MVYTIVYIIIHTHIHTYIIIYYILYYYILLYYTYIYLFILYSSIFYPLSFLIHHHSSNPSFLLFPCSLLTSFTFPVLLFLSYPSPFPYSPTLLIILILSLISFYTCRSFDRFTYIPKTDPACFIGVDG
jgi:hypothetical protein